MDDYRPGSLLIFFDANVKEKGDFTRTGRRDIKGLFADGKISANRYYRRFKKDTLRQQCYDAMQQQYTPTEDVNKDIAAAIAIGPEPDLTNEAITSREETFKQLMVECRKMFVAEDDEDCFGTWLLIDESDIDDVSADQTEPDCVLVLTSTRYFIVCYDETFQKVVSVKETPLTSLLDVEIGSNPLLPSDSSWTLRLTYSKDEQTTGYYDQFRGTFVQVFNTTVLLMKSVNEVNDYVKTIGYMIVSIANCYAQKTLKLKEHPLPRMNSLPHDVEPFQKRMSFSATDTPPLAAVVASNPTATMDKIKNLGSRFSSMVTRQTAPTFNKITTQAKQLPINETVASFLKVIGEGPALVRPGGASKPVGDDGRSSPSTDNSRKRVLQDKFDERKKELTTNECRSKCFFLPSPDLVVIYIPSIN